VPDRPRGEDVAGDHAKDAGEPARGAQQVRHQAQAQEPGVGLALGGVLLEDEPGADHERGQQGEPVVEADVDVHDRLARHPAGSATSQT
jgi:hypothetical protein